MRCRVVFSGLSRFMALRQFRDHALHLISLPSAGFDANFFLFPEDVLGLYSRAMESGLYPERPVTHEEVISFIKDFQKALGPRDFVIFSVYAYVGSALFNAVYLVGERCWFFDFKRIAFDGEFAMFGPEITKSWAVQAKVMAKSSHCIRSGDACIKGLHLFVCADIELFEKMRFGKDALCFVPAALLGEPGIGHMAKKLRGSGRIFINDAMQRTAWDISFGGRNARTEKLEFHGKPYLSVSFER